MQERVTEGYPDVRVSVIDTIATDTFLKGIENKRAELSRKVRIDDAYSDSDEESEFNSRSKSDRQDLQPTK